MGKFLNTDREAEVGLLWAPNCAETLKWAKISQKWITVCNKQIWSWQLPKTELNLQQEAGNGYSPFLYRKQHIVALSWENSTLHKVTMFWGQHPKPRGEINTPAGPKKKCVCEHTGEHVCMSVCMCVHTAVFLKWHIFSYCFSEENWLTLACVDISEVAYSGLSCDKKKTKKHALCSYCFILFLI